MDSMSGSPKASDTGVLLRSLIFYQACCIMLSNGQRTCLYSFFIFSYRKKHIKKTCVLQVLYSALSLPASVCISAVLSDCTIIAHHFFILMYVYKNSILFYNLFRKQQVFILLNVSSFLLFKKRSDKSEACRSGHSVPFHLFFIHAVRNGQTAAVLFDVVRPLLLHKQILYRPPYLSAAAGHVHL